MTALALTTVGCSSRYKLSRDLTDKPSPWPYHRGEADSRGAIVQGAFDGRLDLVWEYGSNDKPVGPLTITHDQLVYPGARNKIKFLELSTGRFRGYIKPKGLAQIGLVTTDTLAFFAVASRSERLKCVNLLNRKMLWQRRLPNAAGAIVADGKLVVGSGAGLLLALNPDDGSIVWYLEMESQFTVGATYSDGLVFQPGDNNVLYAVSMADGEIVYEAKLDGPPVSAAAASENYVYLSDMKGTVYALNKTDGSQVWKRKLSGPIWTAPALADGRLFVGHSGGELVALDASTGEVLWAYNVVDVVRASAVVAGNFVVFGTLTGKLISLNVTDGSVAQERDLGGALSISPVTDGTHIYVATDKGVISCFGHQASTDSIVSK